MWLTWLASAAAGGDVALSPAFAWSPEAYEPDAFGGSLSLGWQPGRVGVVATAEQRAPLPRDGGTRQLLYVPEPVVISPVVRRASLVLDVVALDGEIYTFHVPHALRVHLAAGLGLVATRDDLLALQKTTDPLAIATERQVHPSLELAAALDVALTGTVSWKLGFANTRYTETIETVTRFGQSEVTGCTGPVLVL